MSWVIFGWKGVGKTFVGKRLAHHSGKEFADLDECLEKRHGKSIQELYHEWGEKRFREEEHEMLSEFRDRKNLILSLGGGTLILPKSARVIRRFGLRIYLELPLARALAHPRFSSKATGSKNRFLAEFHKRQKIFRSACNICFRALSDEALERNIREKFGIE
ncbi:MAG: hypothetical protein A3F09_03695 [Chlamydiae bacterium RIFCSPHIGHO2_12_FULL_49_11]|nr:MAG: hypothetical protein A3F09_03695 [Chlamydiae bacterium RIFCSPHIGHO2_12_FULL_49_11]